ncbi:hypothetical protein IH979_00970, partial [Patescibacteria group bacterium]|nr:hypothetical protein [Patescibacteria group bacterium]
MSITSHLKKILIGTAIVGIAAAAYFAASPAPQVQALESLDSIQPGDLFRGETFSAVYFMGTDGLRYIFPNQKAYDTWYTDFSTVRFISDADLAMVQIGGNVTYKPGFKMVKIDTDPATYAVAKGGVLRHVTSEAIAIALYGDDWNKKIDDVPDGFFTNYTIGDPINDASEYDPAAAEASAVDINDDKGLVAPADISVTDSGFSPIDVTISVGQGVRFTNNGSQKHTATGDDLT